MMPPACAVEFKDVAFGISPLENGPNPLDLIQDSPRQGRTDGRRKGRYGLEGFSHMEWQKTLPDNLGTATHKAIAGYEKIAICQSHHTML